VSSESIFILRLIQYLIQIASVMTIVLIVGGDYFVRNYYNLHSGDSFTPVNPLATPEHIKSHWWFAPFYAMSKFPELQYTGAIVMKFGMYTTIIFMSLMALLASIQIKMKSRLSIFPDRLRVFFAMSGILLCITGLGLLASGNIESSMNHMFILVLTVIYFIILLLMPVYIKVRK
jgi:ubiquinol-cytochrome c reductase cytochrome b subunit